MQTYTAWRQKWCNKVLLSFHQFHVIKRNNLTMMWATNYYVNVAVVTNPTKFNLYLLRMRQERWCFYNYLNDPELYWKDCNNYDLKIRVFSILLMKTKSKWQENSQASMINVIVQCSKSIYFLIYAYSSNLLHHIFYNMILQYNGCIDRFQRDPLAIS